MARSDGVANRRRLLDAATVVVAREGLGVPLATVAAEAGVGIGTLYRHFPHREALLESLLLRSLQLVSDALTEATVEAVTAIDALRFYFFRMIEQRDQLILPLRGGPPITSDETIALRARNAAALDKILRRGRAEGSIRGGITSRDIIMMATMLAQAPPLVADWDVVARRAATIYLAGLEPRRPVPE